MKRTLVPSITLAIFCLIVNVIPCGPTYLTPVFQISSSPEFPYADFAAGNIGIIRPEFHRSVLFAAHRYINGGGFSADEQKAMVEVWRAEFRKEDFRKVDVEAAVKNWLEIRKSVAGDEEKLPKIYAEREYGGYDLFPNCTVSAFETAGETLSSRAASYGSEDRHVREWLEGQDVVFANCSSGKATPGAVDPSMPEWLQRDRAYQLAAAAFYSMSYDEARARFAEIALDFSSPWQETADYLVGRTLIRQASVGRGGASDRYYREAETVLERIASSGGRFAGAAEEMLGLVKYRLYPAERMNELAGRLTANAGNQNFRQDLIDFAWLMDKFERGGLEAVERRALETELRAEGIDYNLPTSELAKLDYRLQSKVRRMRELTGSPPERFGRYRPSSPDKLRIVVYSDGSSEGYSFYIDADATDDDALKAAERTSGKPLSEKIREQVINSRQIAYADRFSTNRADDYDGDYRGDIDPSLDALPAVIRQNDLTDWLFVYQLGDDTAYQYSLDKYKEGGEQLWLMTALSKAKASSPEADRLLRDAERSSRTSPAYLTIAFNAARLLIDKGRAGDALRVIADAENYWPTMPISSLNRFRDLRQKVAGDLDTYLRSSLRRPFIFEDGGSLGTLEQLKEEEKAYFNPEYYPEGREAYEAGVEENYAEKMALQDREMFDDYTINIIELFFPTATLRDAYYSQALPAHLKSRFALAIWTRAVLLENDPVADEFTPILESHFPALAESLRFYQAAPKGRARRDAAMYMFLKERQLTPFVRNGYEHGEWWCEPSNYAWDADSGSSIDIADLKPSKFLKPSILAAAKAERARLTEIGNAPHYLARYAIKWADRSPSDPRVPESLFIAFESTGWDKYGCGTEFELHKQIGEILMAKYPQTDFAKKVRDELAAEQ